MCFLLVHVFLEMVSNHCSDLSTPVDSWVLIIEKNNLASLIELSREVEGKVAEEWEKQ